MRTWHLARVDTLHEVGQHCVLIAHVAYGGDAHRQVVQATPEIVVGVHVVKPGHERTAFAIDFDFIRRRRRGTFGFDRGDGAAIEHH